MNGSRAEIDETGNKNTATFDFNVKNPDPDDPDPEIPGNKPQTDTETVYTYALAIQKVDENGKKLAGAEFQLYQADDNGQPTGEAIPLTGGNGKYTVDPDGTGTTTTATMDENGLLISRA